MDGDEVVELPARVDMVQLVLDVECSGLHSVCDGLVNQSYATHLCEDTMGFEGRFVGWLGEEWCMVVG